MLFSCDSHSVSQPSMQYEQCPHALPSHTMATRSPALCRLAPGPVASIMPTPSCPGVNGGVGLTGQSPAAAWMSVWHSPEVCIRISTWPGPGSGIGSSLISSLAPSSGTTAAFIVLMAISPVLNSWLAIWRPDPRCSFAARSPPFLSCGSSPYTESLVPFKCTKFPDATSNISSALFMAAQPEIDVEKGAFYL